MTKKIVVAGSGFAGMWAAISAARAVALTGREQDTEVTIVSPSATLAIRSSASPLTRVISSTSTSG